MKMTRSQVRLADGNVRHRLRIEGPQCPPDGMEHRYRQVEMLQTLSTVPELTQCGLYPFQKMNMHYNGAAWVVEAEAVISEESNV